MNYSDWVNAIAVATGFGAEDENLVALLPSTIDYAEGRIYRDPVFDFLTTRGTGTATLANGSRNVTKPSNVLIVEAVNVITPLGQSPDSASSIRVPLDRVSLAWLDSVWGAQGTTGQPVCYAPQSDTLWRVGPVSNGAWTTEWRGTVRPTALGTANATTFLTDNMPELFVAASMVYLTGALLKNFGAQSDNPQQAQSWETQYGLLKTGPAVEEARRKALSAGGTAYPPAPLVKGN